MHDGFFIVITSTSYYPKTVMQNYIIFPLTAIIIQQIDTTELLDNHFL